MRTDAPRRASSALARLVVSLLVAALLAASPGLVSSGAAQATGLDALLARFARVEGLRCRFHEEKAIALLSAPIVTEGTVHYVRPGRLARRVTVPSPQIVLIEGGRLRMAEGGREETIDLASQPVVRSFVDSFVALLAGDRAALERSYTLTLASAPAGSDAWQLTLRPRAAPLTAFLVEVRFEGHGPALERMVMTEVSGDVTTTRFDEVDASYRPSEAESARVFSLR